MSCCFAAPIFLWSVTSSRVYCVWFLFLSIIYSCKTFLMICFVFFSFAGHQSRESSPTQLCEMLPRPEEEAQTSNQVGEIKTKKNNHPCNRLKPDARFFVQVQQGSVCYVITTRKKREEWLIMCRQLTWKCVAKLKKSTEIIKNLSGRCVCFYCFYYIRRGSISGRINPVSISFVFSKWQDYCCKWMKIMKWNKGWLFQQHVVHAAKIHRTV